MKPFLVRLDAYLTQLTQQGKSPHTLDAYRRDLIELANMLPENQQPTRNDVVRALKQLSQRGQHPRSLARKLTSWRQYAEYLVHLGELTSNPIAHIKAPKPPERLPKAIDREQINQMIDQDIPQSDDVLAIRDHAMIELFYGSGLRLAELHTLNVDDVLLDAGWVMVSGKGKRQRQVPLTRPSIAAIDAYLSTRYAVDGELALFTSRHGTRLPNVWKFGHKIIKLINIFHHICCATVTPVICCKHHVMFVLFRNYLGIKIFPQHKSTLNWILTILHKFMMTLTPAPNVKNKAK